MSKFQNCWSNFSFWSYESVPCRVSNSMQDDNKLLVFLFKVLHVTLKVPEGVSLPLPPSPLCFSSSLSLSSLSPSLLCETTSTHRWAADLCSSSAVRTDRRAHADHIQPDSRTNDLKNEFEVCGLERTYSSKLTYRNQSKCENALVSLRLCSSCWREGMTRAPLTWTPERVAATQRTLALHSLLLALYENLFSCRSCMTLFFPLINSRETSKCFPSSQREWWRPNGTKSPRWSQACARLERRGDWTPQVRSIAPDFKLFWLTGIQTELAARRHNGSESRTRRGRGRESTSAHWSFRAHFEPARNRSHFHVRARLHQTLPLAPGLPGLARLLAVRVRGPDPVLPGVPARHQTGRGNDPGHDVPGGHLLQPERVPLQSCDAQRPVSRRGAAGPAQPEVRDLKKSTLIDAKWHLDCWNRFTF